MIRSTAPRSFTVLAAASAVVSLLAAACATSGTASAPARTLTSSKPAATHATAAPTAAASMPAAPTPSPDAETWQLVVLPGGTVASMGDIATPPGEVVAVGGGVGAAMAWSSHDRGATWTAEPLPRAAASVTTLVPWGDRVLGVGTGMADCPHPSAVDLAVRTNAAAWTAAPFDPLFCAGGTAYAAASGTHAAVVGVGAGDVAYAWSSTDGLHWTDRSDAFSDRYPAGIAGDTSGFVAIGSDPSGASTWEARSIDGTSWTAPHAMTGVSATKIVGGPVTVDAGLAVFLGAAGGQVGIARPDGSGHWTSKLCTGIDSTTVSRIVPVGDGLVALGGDAQGPAAWVSADGVAWSALELPPEAIASGSNAILTGAAVADGRAYLVGQILAPSGDRGAGALWTGPAALLEP